MARTGLRRAVVDPNVVTTYAHAARAALADPAAPRRWQGATGIRQTTWAEVAAAPAIDWGDAQASSATQRSRGVRLLRRSLAWGPTAFAQPAPARPPPPQWAPPRSVECCDLEPGRDLVNWTKPCRRTDVLGGPNFTRRWLDSRGAGAPGA
jgi:hypothetical protein